MIGERDRQTRESAKVQQVRAELIRDRNGRLARSVIVFVLMTAVIVVLAMTTRDTQAIEQSRQTTRMVADLLQEGFAESGRLSTRIPAAGREDDSLDALFEFNLLYPKQILTSRLVGVCCPRQPLPLYLRTPGRHVVLFDGKGFLVQWLEEPEFRQRAMSLGFHGQ